MNYINYTEKRQSKVQNLLPKVGILSARKEIIDGLNKKQKMIPSKFFYDAKGSELFVEITNLPEYYPTRTELSILNELPKKIVNKKNLSFIELGSGDSTKISILLNKINKENLETTTYFPVDISEKAILLSSNELQKKYPGLKIQGIIEDFMTQLHLIPDVPNKVFCFFGSTLGNLTQKEAIIFLNKLSSIMKKNDKLLLGIDLVKDVKTLEEAYNDKANITADFNKNILFSVNKIIKSNFNIDDFKHLSFFNDKKNRIEMHLKAKRDVKISSPFFIKDISIKKNETIHTENSHKFTDEILLNLISKSELKIKNKFMDKNKWFCVAEIEKNNFHDCNGVTTS